MHVRISVLERHATLTHMHVCVATYVHTCIHIIDNKDKLSMYLAYMQSINIMVCMYVNSYIIYHNHT